MVPFWDVLALVLLLISVAFFVLTAVLVVGMLWTKLSDTKSERAVSWARIAVMATAGLLSLISTGAVLGWSQPNLELGKGTSDALTAIGTVSGDVVTATIAGTTLYALILLRKAVSEQVKQLKASAVQNVGSEMLKIDRWMADNVDYFNELRRPATDDTPLGAAIAEVHADLISQVRSQRDYLPAEHIDPWDVYFRDVVKAWPQLRKFIKGHPKWYDESLVDLVNDEE